MHVKLGHGIFHGFHFHFSISSFSDPTHDRPNHFAVVWGNFGGLVNRADVFPGAADRRIRLCQLAYREELPQGNCPPGNHWHFPPPDAGAWFDMEISHHPWDKLEAASIGVSGLGYLQNPFHFSGPSVFPDINQQPAHASLVPP